MGGHVAGAPGVAVVPPGAADVLGPFQYDEVGDPLAAQPHGGAQPAEAGPDHRHPHMLVLGHPGASTPRLEMPPVNAASEHWHDGTVEQLRTER